MNVLQRFYCMYFKKYKAILWKMPVQAYCLRKAEFYTQAKVIYLYRGIQAIT